MKSRSSRHPSVEIEDVEDEDVLVQHAWPTKPNRLLEVADDSNDNGPEVVNISNTSTPAKAASMPPLAGRPRQATQDRSIRQTSPSSLPPPAQVCVRKD
jgi:hypothetical protein